MNDIPGGITVAFVHGAFADSSSWAGVISNLQASDIRAVAIANPLRGIGYDGDYVASAVRQIDGDVVLVGHSYGGAIITHAGARASNVRALVFVAAFVPDTDEVIGALIAAYPPTLLGGSLVTRTFPADDGSSPEVYIDETSFHAVFAADLPDTQVASMAVCQRPIAAGAFAEPLTGIPAWRELPSWFVVATEDRAIDPDSQRAAATRIGATSVEIQASHAVAVSNPARVAGTIAEVVSSLASRKLVRS